MILAIKEIGLIERYDLGIQCTQKTCKDYGVLEPTFQEITNGSH